MSPLEERNGIQTRTTQVDIPDRSLRQPPAVVLAEEVKVERNLRRYIRKDGLFIKGLEDLWLQETGETDGLGRLKKGADGLPRRARTKTAEEAEQFVTAVCEDAGRKVETDHMTGRKKAVPGWDLSIRVPGMASSEEAAARKPEGEERQKINEALLVSQQQEIADLSEKLARVLKLLPPEPPETEVAQPTKPLGQMNHDELDSYAVKNDIRLTADLTKAEKVDQINATLAERDKQE